MREVSHSLHLRRLCLIALGERVPEESTVRKLTRRLGAEVVPQLTREVIQKARREKRFRPRAARIDSTVVEADIRDLTDSGLAADGVRTLAREGRKLAAKIGTKRTAVTFRPTDSEFPRSLATRIHTHTHDCVADSKGASSNRRQRLLAKERTQ